MNKRSVPIAVLSCILAVAGLAGYALMPTPTEAVPTRLLMQNSGGRVVFTHQAHSRFENTPCSACHHEIAITQPGAKQAGTVPGAGAGVPATAAMAAGPLPKVLPCAGCHGAADNPAFVATHQQTYAKDGDKACATCHHARFDGPASGWDHAVHAEQFAQGDCQTCHHPASFAYQAGKTMSHNPQKCSNCHTAKGNKLTPTTLKTAVHTKCEPCHTDLFEQKIAGCRTCHNVVPSASDLQKGTPLNITKSPYASCSSCHEALPAKMDAFHKSCIGCHEKLGKGPNSKAPCAQCHTP